MSMSNIFGGVLAGIGQGYEEVQDRKHKEKREDQKAQRDAAVKMMGDQSLPPSERAYWRKVWLKTHGIADEAKAHPQLIQALDSHMGSSAPPPLAATPPPQMQEMEQRAAVPPPSPEAVAAPEAAAELKIPTLREFAKTRGIRFDENGPDADFNLEHTPGLVTSYNQHVARLETFENRRLGAIDRAAERKAERADMPPPPLQHVTGVVNYPGGPEEKSLIFDPNPKAPGHYQDRPGRYVDAIMGAGKEKTAKEWKVESQNGVPFKVADPNTGQSYYRSDKSMPKEAQAAFDAAVSAHEQGLTEEQIKTAATFARQLAMMDKRAGNDVIDEPGVADPASRDILSQTGLSVPAFYALTGQSAKLSRDAATRKAAMKEAGDFARKNGVDISTLPSQYDANNKTLSGNISRMNNTKIMESELQGTIDNLKGVVSNKELGKLNFVNVAKIWAGQQVNDELAQQYALHLSQLRNELAAYYAATQGRPGSEINLSDQREAEGVIRSGISKGSLDGLAAAIRNSTDKMGKVMNQGVDRSRRAVWTLFGVGGNYRDQSAATPPPGAPSGASASGTLAPITITLPSGKKITVQ